jgi:hypothetical protein
MLTNHLPDAHLLHTDAGHGQAGSWRKSDMIVHGDSFPLASLLVYSCREVYRFFLSLMICPLIGAKFGYLKTHIIIPVYNKN